MSQALEKEYRIQLARREWILTHINKCKAKGDRVGEQRYRKKITEIDEWCKERGV